jgi:hypothetical protein
MVHHEKPTNQTRPMREWIFTRLDTEMRAGIKFNLAVITSLSTLERQETGKKMAAGDGLKGQLSNHIAIITANSFQQGLPVLLDQIA